MLFQLLLFRRERFKMKKYIVNKCDKGGNIITRCEEIMIGAGEEIEFDYRSYYEMKDDEYIDIVEIDYQL